MLGLGVGLEQVEDVDERRADHRVAADPDDRRVADSELGQLVADLVGQRARARDETDPAGREDLGRDDPGVRLARRERARAVRADHRHAAGADVGAELEHVVNRDVLGDADHRPDPGVDRLVDGVGGEAGGDEDERGVGSGLGNRVGDRAEDGDALDVLAFLARRDARRRRSSRRRGCAARGSDPRSRSGPGRPGVSRGRPGSPSGGPRAQGDPVELEEAAVHAVGEQLARGVGVGAGAAPSGRARARARSGGRRSAPPRSTRPAPSRNARHSASL